jgi:hypothetical protein
VDLVGTALGYMISVVQVAEDLNHVIGSPAGLDVNPFRMILPIVPGKSPNRTNRFSFRFARSLGLGSIGILQRF